MPLTVPGNPTNPRAGCNFNGMTLPCSVVAKMASNDAARPDTSQPQGSGPLGLGAITWQQGIFIRGDRPHTGEAYLGNGYEPLMSPNVEFFQQPQLQNTVPLKKNEVITLRKEIKKLLTKRCRAFIDELLNEAGKAGDKPVTTDIEEIFNLVNSQNGFAFATLVEEKGRRGFSSVKGSVGGKDAQVLISTGFDAFPARIRDPARAASVLGELTHVAGHLPSYYATGAYSDVNLANAAYKVANKRGGFMPPPTVDPDKDEYGIYSNYYHAILSGFCNGK